MPRPRTATSHPPVATERPQSSVAEGGVLPQRRTIWSLARAYWLPGLMLLWTFLSLIFPLYDTDFWWHLKTGEWMLAEGWVPQIDLFTFMDSDRPWIDLHWGFQLLITWLYHTGGPDLVILFKATVLTLAVGVAFFATGEGWSLERRVLCWIPGIICITGRGFERPEILSLLFLAIWLWVAFHVDRRPKLIWLLPPLQIVWVNCHALFVLGLVVALCGVADWLGRALLGGWFGIRPLEDAELATLRSRAIVGVLAIAASLVNPYFEEGALFPLTLYEKFSVEQAFYSQQVGEFMPPWDFFVRYRLFAFRNIFFAAECVVAVVAAYSLYLQWRRGGGVSLFRLALLVAFGHLAWKANRNTNLFALVATTVACANFSAAAVARGRQTVSTFRGRLIVGTALGILCCAVVTGVWNQIGEGKKPRWPGGDARTCDCSQLWSGGGL
ncbi:MAG: hypothetical protein NT069_33085 [Planctomycetota bacterium]|nr:hypothetical protein [Planctomycetota bacterium]